uniref:Uncharacterized protein n=1 Tax=Arundo donax TaxID=35708 RepID=A0A0A9DSX4_ARUDO
MSRTACSDSKDVEIVIVPIKDKEALKIGKSGRDYIMLMLYYLGSLKFEKRMPTHHSSCLAQIRCGLRHSF